MGRRSTIISVIAVTIASFLAASGYAQPAPVPIVLINANVASDYIVTAMPMKKSPNCPLIGSVRFFPGGTLSGTFVTDMARSKSMFFTGSYTLTGGKDITFKSDAPNVPLQNINGTIARSVLVNKKRPPIEYMVLTTNTAECANETYKFTLTDNEE